MLLRIFTAQILVVIFSGLDLNLQIQSGGWQVK